MQKLGVYILVKYPSLYDFKKFILPMLQKVPIDPHFWVPLTAEFEVVPVKREKTALISKKGAGYTVYTTLQSRPKWIHSNLYTPLNDANFTTLSRESPTIEISVGLGINSHPSRLKLPIIYDSNGDEKKEVNYTPPLLFTTFEQPNARIFYSHLKREPKSF